MRQVAQTSRFKKDLKREMKGAYRSSLEADMTPILQALMNDQSPPTRCRDHALTGSLMGFRDCHIHPDLVLIYAKIGDVHTGTLELTRLGSHSELGL